MKVSTNQRTDSADEKTELSNGNMSTTSKYSPTVSTCIPGSQRRKQIKKNHILELRAKEVNIKKIFPDHHYIEEKKVSSSLRR